MTKLLFHDSKNSPKMGISSLILFTALHLNSSGSDNDRTGE